METKKIKVYLASGWFTPRTKEILDVVEEKLTNMSNILLYSPRRDGVKLTPYQRHDTALREKVFHDNIDHIKEADLLLANIDSIDSYNDPGTVYEIGYAMANNVPVIGFTLETENISQRFVGILPGFDEIIQGYEGLDELFNTDNYKKEEKQKKVLFIGAGSIKDGVEVDTKLASIISDSGVSLRWINEEHTEIYSRIDEIFEDVEYLLAVVDDRKTIVSWMIGQAYARGIPVVTYSDYNYGINVMLLVSILTHIRGTEELSRFLQKVKREGLYSIPKFDIADLDSM